MKYYFAGWDGGKYKPPTDQIMRRTLESYIEIKARVSKGHPIFGTKIRNATGDFFLDSGAFSAFTRGVVIHVEEYAEFIKNEKVTVAANLDVIGDVEATWKNQRKLEALGCLVLPVVHYGSEKKVLQRVCEEYDYFALGGLVPYARKYSKLKAWLDFAYKVILPYFPKKTHLFGISGLKILERYPAYSCDSTGWLAPVIFGGRYNADTLPSRMTRGTVHPNFVEGNRDKVLLQSVASYHRLEDHITTLWKQRGLTWE